MSKPIPFGKYTLLERINVGGMAEVFRAKTFGVEGFERFLAVKRILSNIAEDEEFITMFIDEAKIAVQLQHANIAQVFDLGKVDDSYFIAMEYIHGKDLRAIFDRLRKLDLTVPVPQLSFVMMQVCEGLDYAHNRRDTAGKPLGLVHRDVSPQNILIGFDGEVKLVDFGIAKAAGKASKTQAGILKGKFGYMSPEQVRGLPVDRRSDIFSVGICLYEMLTGERLFIGESDFSTLEKVRNVEILPPTSFNSKIPAELERIVLKALAKDADDRYQNAIDLHDDLQAFLYSVGDLCSRKDLGAWMKRTFATEMEEENAKLEQYKQVTAPTPEPVLEVDAAGAVEEKPGGGLEWDEEELETQIFDKPPGEEEELSSSDLFVGDQGAGGGKRQISLASAAGMAARSHLAPDPGAFTTDDQTVAQAPSEEFLADMGAAAARAARPSGGHSAVPGSQAPGPASGGPPGGLAEMRRYPGGMKGVGAQTLMGIGAGDLFPGGAPGRAPLTAYNPGGGLPGSTAPYGGAGAPGPSRTVSLPYGLQASSAGGGKGKLYGIATAAMVAVAIIFYLQYSRTGKLQLNVTPANAEIVIDDVPVKNPGTGPILVERDKGVYNIQVSSPGYDKIIQPVEIESGSTPKIVPVTLRPSADTGFQLKSDPAKKPVWLDGKALTASEDGSGPQIETNFKADRVAPGKHVLEIRGDAQFEDWKYDFILEPGRMLAINAELKPRTPATAVGAAGHPGPAAKPIAVAPPVAIPSAPVNPTPVAPVKPPPAVAVKPPVEEPPPTHTTAAKPKPHVAAVAATPVRKPKPAPEPAEKPAAAAATCQITVGAKPWAKVSIDGKDTGKITPLVGYEVACGKHKLTFENSELKVEKSFTIAVVAGEKFKKVFPLVDTDQ